MIEALFVVVPALVLIGGFFFLTGDIQVTPDEDNQLSDATEKVLSRHQLNRSEVEFLLVKHARSAQDSGSEVYIVRTMILRKISDYFLVMVDSTGYSIKFENINELRARRTLFNHKQDYFSAFGEFPHRIQIKKLIESKE